MSGSGRGAKDRLAARDAKIAARLAGKSSGPALDRAPRLMPENRKAWKLFRACSTQLITAGMAGVVIGISHDSLAEKFRWFDVAPEEEADVFEKFTVLERLWVDAMNEKVARK
jgi:hypothetical protein